MERQAPNVGRMKLLGAEVVPVTGGDQTLRAAIDEALRDWVSDPDGTYYLLGSAVGPHPYPYLVRELQSVIGLEARAQMLEQAGALPDVVVACVGGGSNAIGLFHPFVARPRRERCSASRRAAPAAGSARTRPRSPTARRACCRAATRCCCRTSTARSRRRTRSRPASTTRASARSTRCSRASGASTYEAAGDDESLDGARGVLPGRGHPARDRDRARLRGREALRAGAPRQPHPDRALGRGDKDMPTLQRTLLQGDAVMSAAPRHHQRARSATAAAQGRPAVVGFMTAGFPRSRRVPRPPRGRSPRPPTWSRSACRSPTRWPTA